jgi:UDP-glucose 4-epimerase
VTGAAGFIGSHVVGALAARGLHVRALVRSRPERRPEPWPADVEVAQCDLLAAADLSGPMEGVDCVVHLAARVLGSDEQRLAAAVVGTERLFDAAAAAGVGRVVLASSYAVYDWSHARGALDERTPMVADGLYGRDGYTVAKVWQERVARRAAADLGLELTVLRPGFVWGPGGGWVGGAGQPLGPVYAVVGPRARLPLTYVENCADCFAVAAIHQAAAGRTFNVVDGAGPTAWRYVGAYLDGSGRRGVRVPVPYALARAAVRAVHAAMQTATGGHARLPSIAVPSRFEARFKPLRHGADEVQRTLGWSPPVGMAEALRRTYGGHS